MKLRPTTLAILMAAMVLAACKDAPNSAGKPAATAEQATTTEDRTLAVKALTDCAVLAARWRAALGVTPAVVAFPGGAEQS